MTDFDKAIELQPKQARGYYSRGLAYKRQGMQAEAIAEFKKALELEGDTKLMRDISNELMDLGAQ